VEITEVRIKLMEEPGERLQAFCSITIDDCFVVRDLKIIEGTNGAFVAMPSRKLTSHCPQCGCKNHLKAGHCNQCGSRLRDDRAVKDSEGRAKLYADIAHPINTACREMIQERVVAEFRKEQERAMQPGYVSRYDDFDVDIDEVVDEPSPAARGGGEPKFDKTRIQPPERQPRSPHTQRQRGVDQAAPEKSDDSFGAGIF
jgi:stage V sporulation protein G